MVGEVGRVAVKTIRGKEGLDSNEATRNSNWELTDKKLEARKTVEDEN